MQRINISINSKVIGKPPILDNDKDYRAIFRMVNSNFRNKQLTVGELEHSIQSGYAYTAQLYNGYRVTRNFKQAQHIGFDLDHLGVPIEDIADSMVLEHASFLHTTHSDSESNPRSRVVFTLDRPIKTSYTYGLLVRALMQASQVELDEVCKDSVRIFYGAKDCRIRHLGNTFRFIDLLKITQPYIEKIKEEDEIKVAPINISSLNGVSNMTVNKTIEQAMSRIYTCGNDEKHITLLKASKMVGAYVPHYVSFEQAQATLENAIAQRDIRSMVSAKNTITSGLKHGMEFPRQIDSSNFMSVNDYF